MAEPAVGAAGRIDAGPVALEPLTVSRARALVDGDLSGLTAGAGWPTPDTLNALAMHARFGSDTNPSAGTWLVVTAGDGLVVGDCGTKGGPDAAGTVEIGYGLGAPWRGLGLGRALVGGLCRWLLDRPDIRAVTAEVLADNTASRRVLERNGFRLDRTQGPYVYYRLGREDLSPSGQAS